MRSFVRPFVVMLASALMAACATTPPDPSMLNGARKAIELAESADAAEYAPIDLRLARERLQAAENALEDDKPQEARRLGERAELEAQLALVRTQAALARAELQDKQEELDQIRSDLISVFGKDALQP